jgi:hypothetical protein
MMGKCTPFCTALELWSYAGAPAKPTIETLWNGRTGASLRLRQLPAHRQSSANGCEHRLIIERIVGGGGHGDQHGQKEEVWLKKTEAKKNVTVFYLKLNK